MYMMHYISCTGGLFNALKGGLLAHAYTHKSMHILIPHDPMNHVKIL